MRLRELVEGAAAHPNLVLAQLGREALLVEQLGHFALRLCIGHAHERKRPPHEVAPPSAAGMLGPPPSLSTAFHVVGSMFDRAWVNQDLIDVPQHGVQTALVPAGGGGVFDVKIDKPGIYPFVSRSFASVNLGQVGLLKVGDVKGTMSH